LITPETQVPNMSATRQTAFARQRSRLAQIGKLIAIALVSVVSTGQVSAADRETTKEYSTCLDKAGGVTSEMMTCMSAETKRQDARLNENYNKLGSKLSPNRKKALLEAQRAWIKFRDANCNFYYDPDGGSSARMAANECLLNATADRAGELKLLTPDR
jgi:uncharacterized protein YecT (DUF1311 family)